MQGPGAVSGQGTRSHMPQLRVHMPQLKTLACHNYRSHCSQIKKYFLENLYLNPTIMTVILNVIYLWQKSKDNLIEKT